MPPPAAISEAFLNLGVAAGLGLLVGLQRQRAGAETAGIRTFALVTVGGALAGLAAGTAGPWVLAAAFLPLAALIVLAHLGGRGEAAGDAGLTTEAALLAMFLTGVLAMSGWRELATVAGAGVAVLLHLKPQLHALAGRLGEEDFRAVMQFVLVALVVLPVLPDRGFGPYGVVNPRRAWLMVVLITGLGLAGYIAAKCLGARAGTLAAGLLGGLVSSTATTVSFARRARGAPGFAALAALVMMLAAAVLVFRVGLLLRVTAPAVFGAALAPLAAWGAVVLAVASVLHRRAPRAAAAPAELGNPSELRTALTFAALYVGILLAVAAAQDWFGTAGLFAVAVLSGLTDMDAITLSFGRMSARGELGPDTAWRLVLAAGVANTLFKAGLAATLGGPALRGTALAAFGVVAAAGAAIAWWWPAAT